VTLSDFRAGHHPIDDVEGATFTGPGSPPITQITFLTCRAHYPGGPNRCLSVSFPARTAFPGQLAGRRPHPNFRGLLKLHSRYDLQDRSPPKADSCSEAPTRSVSRPSRSVATMLTDNYMGGSSSHWRSAPLGRTVDTLLFEPCKRGHDFAASPRSFVLANEGESVDAQPRSAAHVLERMSDPSERLRARRRYDVYNAAARASEQE